MAKPRTTWRCSQCGHVEPKWAGRCPDCGEFATFVEEVASRAVGSAGLPPSVRPVSLSEVDARSAGRVRTGIVELDRVLGGGLVKGSLVLLGG
jgi:DNA repair protein RadA/Sms